MLTKINGVRTAFPNGPKAWCGYSVERRLDLPIARERFHKCASQGLSLQRMPMARVRLTAG